MFRTRIARLGCISVTAAALAFGATTTTAVPAGAVPTGKQCPSGVLDNCYRKQEMDQFFTVAVRLVEKYFDRFTRDGHPLPHPAAIVPIPIGKSLPSGCITDEAGSRQQDDMSYGYCPTDNRIYIGMEALWHYYHDLGAVSPVAGLAHEYGHYLQQFVGIPKPQSDRETITHENQADCIAGAWTNFMKADGELEYSKDIPNIGALLTEIASQEGPGRTHGTEAERKTAFAQGFRGQLQACDSFYPANPLIGLPA